MLDLLCLYLVNVMRPVFEDSTSSRCDYEDDEEEKNLEINDDNDEQEEEVTAERDWAPLPPPSGLVKRKTNFPVIGRNILDGHHRRRGRRFKDIELLDLDGPKLILGMKSWFILFQIIGQLNWLGKPLYLSIIYKGILIPSCVYVLWRDFLEPITQTINLSDQFKNPIFVFITLSAVVIMLLHVILTIYNNLFNLCPMFKVLTTERLCFVREEVQHIVGSKTMPSMLLFFAINCLLLRMCVARNLDDFVHQFNLIQFLIDYFALLWVGNIIIGVSYIDFYTRVCFGMWIIAMKTNLEYRFAYLQKHQRVHSRWGRSGNALVSLAAARPTSNGHQMPSDHRQDSIISRQSSVTIGSALLPGPEATSTCEQASSTGDANAKTQTKIKRLVSCSSSFSMADHMTLADFKAKYKIDTLDEIQRNLNTMDDHLEVSREFQNNSLVLITLSAFLTNGSLLLLAYNLLANQKMYFHGILIASLSASYTICIFLCYIGDSWISYALESFVQTVEDEYFLQSGGGGGGDDACAYAGVCRNDGDESTLPRRLGEETISSYEPMMQSIGTPGPGQVGDAPPPPPPNGESDFGSENAPTGQLAIAESYQVFTIKKRDVLFCREFLHQFHNHLATPWSKLTVKIQLHMLGTFVTLIAAQIIFDREH